MHTRATKDPPAPVPRLNEPLVAWLGMWGCCGPIEDHALLGTVVVDGRTEKLPGLLGRAARLQLRGDELRRLKGVVVDVGVQPLTGDLGDPGVVVLLPVDA